MMRNTRRATPPLQLFLQKPPHFLNLFGRFLHQVFRFPEVLVETIQLPLRKPLLPRLRVLGSRLPPPDSGAARYESDVHYRTCPAILMFETCYRFLPATGAGIR